MPRRKMSNVERTVMRMYPDWRERAAMFGKLWLEEVAEWRAKGKKGLPPDPVQRLTRRFEKKFLTQ